MSQNQAKEIKEYKDFTTITNIRKITQEAINPVMQSLEKQLTEILTQTHDLKKKSARIDDILKNQRLIDQRIADAREAVRDLKDNIAGRRKEDDKKFNKLDNSNEKIFLEIHDLRSSIKNQDQSILQIKKKNDKTYEIYAGLQAKTEATMKDLQYKYSDFTKEILDINKMVKLQYSDNKTEMELVKEAFKRQRNEMQEKFKGIKLYFKEREEISKKIQQIYQSLLLKANQQDFEGYRLSQKKLFEEAVSKFQNKLTQVLPPSLQKLLPTIQKKLQQVEKIQRIVKDVKYLQEKAKSTEKQVKEAKGVSSKGIEGLSEKITSETLKIKQILEEKVGKIEASLLESNTELSERMIKFEQNLQDVLENNERERTQIFKTIQEQISSQKASLEKEKQEKITVEIEKVKAIRDKILSRYKKIEELGSSIDYKIESYSSKITKIRSDYELFSEGMRKQMRENIKFKTEFTDKLTSIGGILSSYAEMFLFSGSFLLQDKMEKDAGMEVFVTDNDGIIYQWKGMKNSIFYRKHKADPKILAKAYMYSMATYVDDIFAQFPFLNWVKQKPSQFFRERVQQNYLLHAHRQINQNYLVEENKEQENQKKKDILKAVEQKPMTKTIQARVKNEIQLAQKGNCFTEGKRTYSIKKQKMGQKNRYQYGFLSSRSACKSRLSQVF